MKFLKVHNQRVINTKYIAHLTISGTETDAHMEAVMHNGDIIILARFKSFPAAETRLAELVSELEAP